MNKHLYICVDIGQTRLKMAIYDSELNLKTQESIKLYTIENKEGYAERDMQYLWQVFFKLLKKIILSSKFISKNIKYLCITAHGDGCFPIDVYGEPTRNAIISQDTRSREISDKINKQKGKKILKLTGQLTNSNNPAMIIKWLKNNEPNIIKNTKWFLYCKDWIKYKLTNVISTDYSSASAGLTNVITGLYDDKILDLYKIKNQKNKLPPINKPNKIVGKIKTKLKKKLGLIQDIKVFEGLHDVSSAMLGMGCSLPNNLLVIGGTFGIAQIISKKPFINKNLLCRTTFESKKWLNISFTPSCSNSIDWILKITNFKISNIEKIFAKIDKGKNNNIIFYPYLYGGQTGRKAYGRFQRLEGSHNKEDLIISVIEGVIFNLVNQIEFMIKNFTVKKIIITGGMFKIKILSQVVANLLNKNIYFNDETESGILGVAMLSLSTIEHKNLKKLNIKYLKTKVIKPNNFGKSYIKKKYKIFCKHRNEIS